MSGGWRFRGLRSCSWVIEVKVFLRVTVSMVTEMVTVDVLHELFLKVVVASY